jgi:hypothetical protein
VVTLVTLLYLPASFVAVCEAATTPLTIADL